MWKIGECFQQREILYKVLLSSNLIIVNLERDSGNKLILKTQKSSRYFYENGTVYVNDDDDHEDNCSKPADQNDGAMIYWADDFHKIYLKKYDDLNTISQKLNNLLYFVAIY